MSIDSRKMPDNNPRNVLVLAISLLFWCQTTYAFCPHRCVCDDDRLSVWCEGASLDVIPMTLNPGLKELYLSNNSIRSITGILNFYLDLEYLDLSYNRLAVLARDSFMEQTRLKILNLSGNRIPSVQTEIFSGLGNLNVLRLKENLLLTIPDHAFHHLSSLWTLDLSGNRISSISPLALHGPASLTKLLLRENKLTQVPTSSFSQVTSLTTLDLGKNQLEVIGADAFSSLNSLESLAVDGCNVHLVEPGAFKGMTSLHTIYLQDNDITNLPISALSDVAQLRELHLGQNHLKTLKPYNFSEYNSNNTLAANTPDERGAEDNQDNYNQDGANHQDKPHTLRDLPHLKFISLRGNEFTTFAEDSLQWENLDSFDIRNNPLVCDCTIAWMRHILKTKNFTGYATMDDDVTRVVCTEPPQMNGTILGESTLEDLNC